MERAGWLSHESTAGKGAAGRSRRAKARVQAGLSVASRRPLARRFPRSSRAFPELGRREASALPHPIQGGSGLDVSDRGRAMPSASAYVFRKSSDPGSVDQSQRTGIEVKAQRLPSETYSVALLPPTLCFVALAGK